VGRNGTGKSTILNALEYGIVGDPTVFGGSKESNISQFAGSKDPAFVSVQLEHDNHRLDVTRHLSSSKTEMSIDGDRLITGAERVNATIAEYLAVPLSIISGYVFTKQRRIFDFLVERPAERAWTFQTLFGTDRAIKLYDLLGEELEQTPVIQLTDELKDLNSRWRLACHREWVANEEFKTLEPMAAEAEARAFIAAVTTRKCAVAELIKYKREVRELELPEINAWEKLNSFSEVVLAHVAALESLDNALEVATVDNSQWITYEQYQQTLSELSKAIQLQEDVVAAITAPIPPTEQQLDASKCYMEDGAGLFARIDKLRSLIWSFTEGVTRCPTCGTPTDQLTQQLNEARAVLPNLEAEHKLLRASYFAVATYNDVYSKYSKDVAKAKQALAKLQGRKDALVVIEQPTTERIDIAALQQERDELNILLNAARSAHIEQVRDHERLWSRIVQLATLCDNLHDELAANPRPARTKYAEAQILVAQAVKRAERRAELRGQMAELKCMLDEFSYRQAAVKRQISDVAAAQAWRNHVLGMRGYVHRDKLPKLVSQSYLARLEDDINSRLTLFKSRFSIQTTSDLSFTAHYIDGRVQPAIKLSPGEKVVLALAFRVAVNSVFAQTLGIFALDEPTDGLDSENIVCVQTALESLTEISHSQGLQVFIVSHDNRLQQYCDTIIDLGGW